jgi:hypothetical protein
MICVTIEIREGALTHRVQTTASSIERALKVAGGEKPGRKVRLLFSFGIGSVALVILALTGYVIQRHRRRSREED